MPASLLMEEFDNLHRTLSMSVPFISENLVGRVFLGKTCVIVECKYSLVVGLCSNFSRSMLKSRTITTFVFQVDTKNLKLFVVFIDISGWPVLFPIVFFVVSFATIIYCPSHISEVVSVITFV